MIEKLTKKQEALIPIIRDKWIRKSITPTGRDAATIEKNVKWLYEQAKLQPVPVEVCFSLKEFSERVASFIKNSSVESSVRSSVGLYYWGSDLAYFDFWKEVNILTDRKIISIAEQYVDALSDAAYGFMTDKICIILTKPTVLTDVQWRLHNPYGLAMQWQDGTGEYFLHGVTFEKSLWKKVTERSLSFTEVLAIKDIDQRWVAMKFMEPQKLIEGANGKLLQKSERGNELYLFEGLFPNAPKAFFLKYACPSTGRVYLSGVSPEIGERKDADAAMGWKHHMDKHSYLAMTPLVHES